MNESPSNARRDVRATHRRAAHETGPPPGYEPEERINKAAAAVAGFVAGGAAGFVATEAGAAFFHFVLGITPDAENVPALIVVFMGVPLLFAVAGVLVGLRVAARVNARGARNDGEGR
jgi:hypothetical protein